MWAIVTLAALAGLIILVLCVPIDAVLNLDTSGRPRFRLRLVWFFGLISKELGRKKKKPEEKKEVIKEKRKKKRGPGFSTILKILRTKGLLGQIQIKELVVNLKLGLDDPADTGLLFAVIGSATPFLNSFPRYQIRVQPSIYGEAVCEGYLRGALRLRPIQLVIPLSRFVFSLAMLRLAKILVLSKWKRKK